MDFNNTTTVIMNADILEKTHLDTINFCKNMSQYLLDSLRPKPPYVREESANAFLYIVFVLMFYACSIVILMVKYIRKERESSKLDYYYDEFVKRERFLGGKAIEQNPPVYEKKKPDPFRSLVTAVVKPKKGIPGRVTAV